MKIVFLSNYFTHHQKPLADALSRLTRGNYTFIATLKMSEDRKSLGWNIENPDYVTEISLNNKDEVNYAIKLVNEADVVLHGSIHDYLISERVKQGKLTFFFRERLYKSPSRLLKLPLYFAKGIKFKNCYVLSASAFTSYDYSLSLSFIDRCFKFGYFPKLVKYQSLDELFSKKNTTKIIWVARFICWKHPEIAVEIARRLKSDGYKFSMELIGTGPMLESIRQRVISLQLDNNVKIVGAIPADEVRSHMEESGIHLFTSDKNEGWGAVLNESMNSGCAVVANSKIGSVPYMLNDGSNGFIYKDGDIDAAYSIIKRLLDDIDLQRNIGTEALKTVCDTWNANVAAKNFIQLVNDVADGNDTSILDGPCSKASIIKDNWYH